MSTKGFCDNCGKERYLSHGYGAGLETWQCWECTGSDPTCDVCGEELENGKCTWCFGDPKLNELRSLLQKIDNENKAQLQDLKTIEEELGPRSWQEELEEQTYQMTHSFNEPR